MSERACATCGKSIADKRPHARFCGNACRAEEARLRAGGDRMGNPGDAKCARCGAPTAAERKGRRYCSDACKRAAARLRAAERQSAPFPAAVSISAGETAQSRAGDALAGGFGPALCPYPRHRESDWLSTAGQVVCGVCHPPATEPGRRAPTHAREAGGMTDRLRPDDFVDALVAEVMSRLATDSGLSVEQLRTALRQFGTSPVSERAKEPRLSVAAVAERVGRDPQFIRREIKVGHLAAHKLGRRFAISEGDLTAWLASAQVEASVSSARRERTAQPAVPTTSAPQGGLRRLLNTQEAR